MPNRPAIPADVSREILLESGHRCAVDGTPTPLERAHIIPWHETQDHSPENLICLCANCHRRADRENWGADVLREYKQRPWIHRNYDKADPMPKPKGKLKLTIGVEIESYDHAEQQWLLSALASFLDLSSQHIQVLETEAGSTKVTIELPRNAATKLKRAFDSHNPELIALLSPITLIAVQETRSIKQRIWEWVGSAASTYEGRLGIVLTAVGGGLLLLLSMVQLIDDTYRLVIASVFTLALITCLLVYVVARQIQHQRAYAALGLAVAFSCGLGLTLTYPLYKQYIGLNNGSPTRVSIGHSPTPVPSTNTPIVYTATPTLGPSDTATPTRMPPTNTPRPEPTTPKPTPTPRPPTNTPAPQFPWRGVPAGTFSNCGLTAYMGLTLDRSGGVAGDVVIHYWTDGWDGAWAVSEWVVNEGYAGEGDEKNWDGIINNHAVDGTWYACVVSQPGSWDCLSNTMSFTSVSTPCEPDSGGVQIFRVVFQKN